MSEEKPVIRRIIETVAFDPERGTYRAVEIRIEYPKGVYHSILIPIEEYDPDKVDEYVKNWLKRYGKWIGKSIELK